MTSRKSSPGSIARQVRDYLDGHPVLADAIRLGIGNYSAIARRIGTDLGQERPEAIIAACRRYPRGRGESFREAGVRRVLRKSRIETRTKVAAITLAQGIDVLQRLGDVVEELLDENSLCRLIQVSRGTVVIVDEESVLRVTKELRGPQVLGVHKGLVELAVTGPESIEETPGLLTLLTGVLSAQGINIVEALSCYTDTIFLLDQRDLNAAIAVLTQTLG
ncbi:MAG TPA: ACT domain-containing protein [Thermoplasmata archaeon]|nr:ACT domain-containing protein [Thermoplasmata archaeon]